ncbi:MAG: TRAP transporter large permease subunit [Spirochaetaceae bacterium]|nr:TRAP transporter large permease subunit [Spirochaetaceae bacterium]
MSWERIPYLLTKSLMAFSGSLWLMLIIINIMIGGITPPFGSMMFTTCSITKVSVGDFMREIWPFILALLTVLIVVTYIPAVVMFLPNLF